jgi:hypothetical protein
MDDSDRFINSVYSFLDLIISGHIRFLLVVLKSFCKFVITWFGDDYKFITGVDDEKNTKHVKISYYMVLVPKK